MKRLLLSMILVLCGAAQGIAQYSISGGGTFSTLLSAPPGGAGQEFPQPVAGPTGATLDVSGPSGGGITTTWCVWATDSGYNPLLGKNVNVIRSSDGVGAGSILGGFPISTSVPLTPGPVNLFCGEGSLAGIQIDYTLQGLSVLNASFSAAINFMITPFP